VAELTGSLLVCGAHGGELFEHEGEVVDCEVGSDGAGLLGTFEQLHVELLGPFCSEVQLERRILFCRYQNGPWPRAGGTVPPRPARPPRGRPAALSGAPGGS
jgi:hypothetical protein